MAAYAAVISLIGTIHQFPQSQLDLQEDHIEHLKLLNDKVSSLQELLDNIDNESTNDLQEKVKDLAHEAEDQIESYLQQMVMEKDEHVRTEANKRLLEMLQRAIEDVESVNKELNNNSKPGNRSLGGSSSPRSHVSTLENDMVGYNIEQDVIRSQLRGRSSQLEVISITGMGGIGKSTFAKKMFNDPSIMSFFSVRGWITVSKDYSLRKMLLCLLQDAIGVKGELEKMSDGDLADRLQKSLKGKRYLIVVDNIWSTEAWDDIRLCFPENNNTSRILLTTRDMNVAQYASSPKDPFPMRFLEPEESWNLFCQKAFGKKDCPNKFDNVAKVVVERCKGLPLMISVVAGILSSKTLDEWIKIAQSMSLLVNFDDYQHCSRVLALSYKHLPSHLKACFLYFGVFPKAREISVKKLIRLWVAEGLVELKGLEGLEKVASNLLHDLIDKSLVVVSRRSLAGKINACRIHDLLHDLCLKEAEGERLLYSYVVDPESFRPEFPPEGRRWVSVHSNGIYHHIHFDDLTLKRTRSLNFSADKLWPDFLLRLGHFKLVRVLDLEAVEFSDFPSEILHLVGLRYLAVTTYKFPDDLSLSNFWNLQTLIVSHSDPKLDGRMYVPIGIWQVYQLRHLICTSMYLYPPRNVSAKHPILENLLSVSGLSPSCCTKEIVERIKKVKKLGVFGGGYNFLNEPEWLDNLKYLHELEALNIAATGCDLIDSYFRLPCADSFPPNLNKLTLSRTYLPWEDMTIISKLPKLEVLQLKVNAFFAKEWSGEMWEVTEIGYLKLKFLLLEDLQIMYWRADDDYFPCLERVIIRNCHHLKEIPQGFADSVTLQLVELHECSPTLVNFAEQIKNEQEYLGNNILKVHAFDKRVTIEPAIVQRDSDEVATEEISEKVDEDSEEDTKCCLPCGNLFSCFFSCSTFSSKLLQRRRTRWSKILY